MNGSTKFWIGVGIWIYILWTYFSWIGTLDIGLWIFIHGVATISYVILDACLGIVKALDDDDDLPVIGILGLLLWLIIPAVKKFNSFLNKID